ncbi:MAG: hypothetical protein JHD16_17445 [Solirubrobacteraceae bacterium]|nr:hypothetical protein [Solirubrobacteraceae bacterium]
MSPEPQPSVDLTAENARLQARVDQLEQEISDLRASTAATVASAQETLYWFERWGLDFNSIMSRPEAEQARKTFRALRSVYRRLVHFKRRITG